VTGYCVLIGDSPILWRCKNQSIVAYSMVKVQYRAIAKTTCEATWLLQLFKDLGIPNLAPMMLKCDNQASLYIVDNLMFRIEVDRYFIRDKMKVAKIQPTYASTKAYIID